MRKPTASLLLQSACLIQFVLLSKEKYVVEAFVYPYQAQQPLSPCCLYETTTNSNDGPSTPPIRLNKVFKATHSRRQADALIASGRVTVNGVVSTGCMVVPYRDIVELDGRVVQDWESMNGIIQRQLPKEGQETGKDNRNATFEYIKYWKPKGIICTTDEKIRYNIIDEITRHGGYRPKHRVYPVGRLDKDTSGLILLTSDGRLPNASLKRQQKQPKVYQVLVDSPLSDAHVQQLRDGIVITTVAQRDNKAKPLTARTKPCRVQRHATNPRAVQMTLQEGRNRQIRKMMQALGHQVVVLHRVQFGNVSLRSLQGPGDWKRLDDKEMQWIDSILRDSMTG